MYPEVENRGPSSVAGRRQLLAVGFDGRFPPLLRRILTDEFPHIEVREEETARSRPDDPSRHAHGDVLLLHESVLQRLDTHGAWLSRRARQDIVALVYPQSPPDRATVQHCMSLGIGSFLSFHTQLDLFVSAISMMLSGGRYIAPEILDRHFVHRADERPAPIELAVAPPPLDPPPDPAPYRASDRSPSSGSPKMPAGLTAREREVLALVADGKQNKVIAHELGLSQSTVKLHVHHLITKLGVHNRTELAIIYHAHRKAGGVGPAPDAPASAAGFA